MKLERDDTRKIRRPNDAVHEAARILDLDLNDNYNWIFVKKRGIRKFIFALI